MWNFKTLKIQRTFQNWSKVLELWKSFTTYKWNIIYMMCFKKTQLIKKLKNNVKNNSCRKCFWLWFEIVIIFINKTLNLQGIKTLSKFHIYSQMIIIKILCTRTIISIFLKNCRKNYSKIHLCEKKSFGKNDRLTCSQAPC
jgi:hypothetical protein